MEKSRKTTTRSIPREVDGFDVVCTIGRVEFSENGTENPHVVAFKLIAQHDTEGIFRFPMPNGQTCAVTVEHEGESPSFD